MIIKTNAENLVITINVTAYLNSRGKRKKFSEWINNIIKFGYIPFT